MLCGCDDIRATHFWVPVCYLLARIPNKELLLGTAREMCRSGCYLQSCKCAWQQVVCATSISGTYVVVLARDFVLGTR
jgi:hypothetical protein